MRDAIVIFLKSSTQRFLCFNDKEKPEIQSLSHLNSCQVSGKITCGGISSISLSNFVRFGNSQFRKSLRLHQLIIVLSLAKLGHSALPFLSWCDCLPLSSRL